MNLNLMVATAPPRPGQSEQEVMSSGGGRRLIVVALFVATFLVALDASVISTAMPTVIGQLGGIQLYAWVFSAYLLTTTISVPIYGKLSDLYGRKPLFLAATTLFLVGSALCGQSQTMEQLIAFRLVQGLGAGGVFPITQTILGDVFPLEERARLNGVFASVWGVSALLGPGIGGFLTERASWRWVFYVNLPLCLLAIALIWYFLHERVVRRPHRIDYLGALLLSGGVTALLVGVQVVPSSGPGVPAALALFASALVLFLAFVWQERRHPEPLVPLDLFGNRVIGLAALGALLSGVILFCQGAFVPPFTQGVTGATPTIAGFVVAGTSIGWPAAATVSGRIMLRLGYRVPAVIGGVLLILGFGWMAALPATAGLVEQTAIQVVIGAGFGFYLSVSMLSVQNAVGWEQRGVVTSSNQFARTIGGAVGVAVAGAIFAAGVAAAAALGADSNLLLSPATRAQLPPEQLSVLQGLLAAALRSVYLLCVGLAILATLVACFLPGGRPRIASSVG